MQLPPPSEIFLEISFSTWLLFQGERKARPFALVRGEGRVERWRGRDCGERRDGGVMTVGEQFLTLALLKKKPCFLITCTCSTTLKKATLFSFEFGLHPLLLCP